MEGGHLTGLEGAAPNFKGAGKHSVLSLSPDLAKLNPKCHMNKLLFVTEIYILIAQSHYLVYRLMLSESREVRKSDMAKWTAEFFIRIICYGIVNSFMNLKYKTIASNIIPAN